MLRLMVANEAISIPKDAALAQSAMFRSMVGVDMDALILPDLCQMESVKLFAVYVARRGPNQPLLALDPPPTPWVNYDLASRLDEVDRCFVDELLLEHRPWIEAQRRVLELFRVADYLQHGHLRALCAAVIACTVCSNGETSGADVEGKEPSLEDVRRFQRNTL